MAAIELLSEAYGEALPETLPTLHELLAKGPHSANDLALACLHQPASLLSTLSGSFDTGYLRWTFTQLTQVSHACARAMAADGLRPGSRIVAYVSNCAEFHVLFRAALILNCVFCPINAKSASNTAEVHNVFDIVKPDLVVAQDSVTAASLDGCMQDLLETTKIVLDSQEGPPTGRWQCLHDFMEQSSDSHDLDELAIKRKADDVILVLMTSGTTSLPKGCPHTNRSITSAIQSYAIASCCDRTRSICAHLPMSHIFTLATAYSFHIQGLPVVHASPYFEPGATLKAIREERISDFGGVPAIINALLGHGDFAKTDTSCLQWVVFGAAAATPVHVRKAMMELGARKVGYGWGMTEGVCGAMIAFKDCADEPPEYLNCGHVVQGARLRVCDPGSGKVVVRGQPGELLLGGRMIIDRYWTGSSNDDTSSSFVTDEHGKWIKTGDQAVMGVDGSIQIVGRYKDLIIRGGENIAPAAIEALLLSEFDLVAEVIGVPDEIAGEVPAAVIKAKQGLAVPTSDIQKTLVRDLGLGYMLEDIILLDELQLDDFPKNSTGKVQKGVLKILVGNYLKRQASSSNGSNSLDIALRLTEIWRKLLKVETLTASDDIRSYADSLVIARFPGVLKKELGRSITIQEISTHTSAAAQAKLLASRKESAKETILEFPEHDGPPTCSDMVHTQGNADIYRKTRQLCEDLIQPMGLGWNDVKDVLPLYSISAFFLTRRRPQSYNHRHAHLAPGAGVEECRSAIENALAKHDMLRTLAIQLDSNTPLHVIMRPSEAWYDHCITIVEPVNTAEDLKSLLWNDPHDDYAAFPGPLLRIVLTHVREENCAGFFYVGQHSVFDAISFPYFLEDLNALLAGQHVSTLPTRVPYKAWIDSEYNLRGSTTAKVSIEWHAQRLAGLRFKRQCLFPTQRAPEWFKGDSKGWIEASTGLPGPDRAPLDASVDGATGFSETCDLPDMQRLKQKHGIDMSTLMKAALALLNTELTGQDTALFTHILAGRSWPYLQQWQAAQLPSALEVDGPTLQFVVVAVEIPQSASALEFMKQLQIEQTAINQHAHQAPFSEIAAKLNERGEGEGDIMYDVARRQLFNWLPAIPGFERLRRVQQISRSDQGILWNFIQRGSSQVQVLPSWDDAQLAPSEVKDMLADIIRIAGALATEENWSTQCGKFRMP